jgi:hypothetical protein
MLKKENASQVASEICHFNGGIEQALLQLANDDNVISESDKQRLEYLKSLPQSRVEFDGKIMIPEQKAN